MKQQIAGQTTIEERLQALIKQVKENAGLVEQQYAPYQYGLADGLQTALNMIESDKAKTS